MANLLNRMKEIWGRHVRRRQLKRARRRIDRFPLNAAAPRHVLPGTLIVSLTSFPLRFATLPMTIKSLIDQSVRPDRIILWLAHEDSGQLPAELTALTGDRFEIRACDDLRSYNKIVHALAEFPETFIVTVDDDIAYPPDLLERLIAAYDPADPTIVCHRAHRLVRDDDGTLAPYHRWAKRVADRASEAPSTDLLPTGVGGVLYPPGSLPPEATDRTLIARLSPACDDSWLYFIWRKSGWRAKRAPGPSPQPLVWPKTQASALRKANRGGRKDEQLQALCRHFGVP